MNLCETKPLHNCADYKQHCISGPSKLMIMMMNMIMITDINHGHLYCVTLLFWNLLAFLLLLIAAHLFWDLCENYCDGFAGDDGDGDDVFELNGI